MAFQLSKLYVCELCHRLNDRPILYEKNGICLHRSTSKINIDSYNEICCTQISSSTRKKNTTEIMKRNSCMKIWETFKDCLHDAIATAIYLSQLMGCMGFSIIAAIAQCGHFNRYVTEPICCDQKNC